MISTSYHVTGIETDLDVLKVRLRVSDVANVGAVAMELQNGGDAKMIIKHKEDVEVRRTDLEEALAKAGSNYALHG